MIVSFSGSYEKANDDVEIVSATQASQKAATKSESQGYIAISNDWSDSSKLVRPYTNVYFNNGDTAFDIASAKVVSDSVVINIDMDGYKADDATPSKAEEFENLKFNGTTVAKGYYANAFVIVNSDNEIELLVYETSNRIHDGGDDEVILAVK